MKIITLNTWGGRIKEPLLKFIEENNDIDVFCFQEIWHEAEGKVEEEWKWVNSTLFSDISSILSNHNGYFCPTVDDYYGIATFIKKDFKIKASGDIDIYINEQYNGGANHSRKMLWVEIENNEKMVSVLNVHGLWNGQGKTDTPDRITQSKNIREFMDSVKGLQVLCGDFNLLPETESLKILENGMQNLVKDYNIQTTRTSLYERSETSGKFADYVFVSPELKVNHFEVMSDEVSDHCALLVEVDI